MIRLRFAPRGWLPRAFVLLAALVLTVISGCGGGGGGGSTSLGSSGGTTGGTGGLPTANFSASPTTVGVGSAVTFTDLSTSATSWAWDLDGDSVVDSTSQNPGYTYPAAGSYTVTLTVANASGSDVETKAAYITVTSSPPTSTVDIDADTNRDGQVSSGADDETGEDSWSASQGAVYYYNLDDDDSNSAADHADTSTNGAADISDLAQVVVRQYANPPANGSVLVSVGPSAAQGKVRIFRYSGGSYTSVYSSGSQFTLSITDIGNGDITLAIEARDRMSASWDGHVTLTLDVRNQAGSSVGTDTVELRCAPPLFATNLWTIEEYHVVSINSGGDNNVAMRTTMQSICNQIGITYREAPGASYSYDRWLQDSSEPAVVYLPSASAARRRVDQVFQCARWRPVDDWAEDTLWGPDMDFFARFSSTQYSVNYGGNFEIIPPHTAGAADYPWGRVSIGGGDGTLIGTSTSVSRHMSTYYRDIFAACEIQLHHIELTTEWLAVGHIDEYTAYLPAPATSRGWVVAIASTDLAYQILQAAQTGGNGNAVVFNGRASQTTVNGILNNASLAAYNQEVQQRIDSTRTLLKTACGLTDADFVELPVLFEDVGGAEAAALNPGVVNMVTFTAANGAIYFAVPDPEGPHTPTDLWADACTAALTALGTVARPVTVQYVDVFESYHELLGEAHCGSNVVRTPPDDDWWDN